MQTKTLDQLVSELAQKQTIAQTNLDDIPWMTRPAWSSNIERAKEELTVLKAEYRNKLLAQSLAIFVVGGTDEQKAAFASIAKKEADVLVLNADDLYKRLAQPIDAALGTQRTFTATYVPMLLRGMKEVGDELAIREIAAPKFSSETPILEDSGAVVELVREVVRDSSGDDLNRLYLADKLTDQALAVRYKGSVVPVIVLGAGPDEVLGLTPLFAHVGALVSLDGVNVDKELVLASFEQALKQVKTKKN